MRIAAMPFLAALTLAGAACDGPRGGAADGDGAATGAAEPSMTAPAAAPTVGSSEQADEARSLTRGEPGNAAGGAPPAPSGETQFTTAIPTTGMVIRTGNASLEVDSLEPAIAAIRRLVGRVGGYVGNTSLQAGDESVRNAMRQAELIA